MHLCACLTRWMWLWNAPECFVGSGARRTGGTRGWTVKQLYPICGYNIVPLWKSLYCDDDPLVWYSGTWRRVCWTLVFFTPLRGRWCITRADDKIVHHISNQSGLGAIIAMCTRAGVGAREFQHVRKTTTFRNLSETELVEFISPLEPDTKGRSGSFGFC